VGKIRDKAAHVVNLLGEGSEANGVTMRDAVVITANGRSLDTKFRLDSSGHYSLVWTRIATVRYYLELIMSVILYGSCLLLQHLLSS
jgi:hypothetical protein